MLRKLGARISTQCFRALRDGSAVVSPLMALMIIPIAGATAMSVELGQWYYFHRAMQNAADASALAAAINHSDNYADEATGAAREFGFVQGQDNTTVQPQAPVPCADLGINLPDDTCYEVRLSKSLPITFSALVGFRGDNGGFTQTIRSSAVATTAGTTGGSSACIWTLSNASDSFRSNGTPFTHLDDCSILSNGGAVCNGNLDAAMVATVNTSTGCEDDDTAISESVTAPEDTYDDLAPNIQPNNCGSTYSTIPKKKGDPALPANNLLTASNANTPKCGDVQLTSDVTLTGSNTLTIFNGTLDLNGHKLTASGTDNSATIIFSGTNGGVKGPSGTGTLDIQASSSGTWAGVAMYQDPRFSPSSTSITYDGNTPAWDISGLVYFPKSNITFKGIVDKSGSGQDCFVLVALTVLVSGTGEILGDNEDCDDFGFDPPGIGTPIRERLVR